MAAGSEVSDDAASWETVNDDEMDTLENAQEVCLVFFFFFFSLSLNIRIGKQIYTFFYLVLGMSNGQIVLPHVLNLYSILMACL